MYQKNITKFFFYLILFNVFFSKNNTLLAQNKDIFQKIFSDSTENNTNILPKTASTLDSTHFFIIDEINFKGNKKTKISILTRELAIKIGDTLSKQNIDAILLKERNKIFNTNLFVVVKPSIKISKTEVLPVFDTNKKLIHTNHIEKITVLFILQERWYWFPVVIFELADRNFNEWWNDRGRDLGRTNFGGRLTLGNVRGRNENLSVLLQFGFTPKVSFSYQIPYIDKRQKYGLGFNIVYARNKQIAYQTENNKLTFLKSEKILRERFQTSISITRRENFYTTHSAELKYSRFKVDDTILQLNSNYHLDKNTQQNFFQLSYSFVHDRRDVQYYPLKGYRFEGNITKLGLSNLDDINLTSVYANIAHFKPLSKRFYSDITVSGRVFYGNKQPYAQAQGLGYGADLLRGYQLYVIDGQSYALLKPTLKYELFKVEKYVKWIPIQQFRTFPVSAYARIYTDIGYITDKNASKTNNQLANQFLYTTGVGIDIVSFYNLVLQFDYSINKQQETGFFFGINSAF